MARYENPKTGEVIETEMEEDYAVDHLPTDSAFAKDLKKKYKEEGAEYMSDAQIFWIMKLAGAADKFHECDTKEIFELLDKGKLRVKFKALNVDMTIYQGGVIYLNGTRVGEYTETGIKHGGNLPVEVLTKFLLVFAEQGAKDCFARIGRKTGICCYCGRTLTAGTSLEVGYGPICAEKYGLYYPSGEENAI